MQFQQVFGRRIIALCLAVTSLGWCAVAGAQSGGIQANLDSFEPMPVQGQGAVLNVATARPLGHLEVSGGLVVYDAFDLAGVATLDGQDRVVDRESIVDSQLTAEAGATIGLGGVADVGVVVPVVFQNRGLAAPMGAGESKLALADIRVYPRVALVGAGDQSGVGLGVVVPIHMPLGSQRVLVSGGQWSAAPTAVADWTDPSGWQVAVNAGYTWRQQRDAAFQGDTVDWRLGARMPLGAGGLDLVASLFGQVGVDDASPAAGNIADVAANPLEVVGAIEWHSAGGLTASVGGGRGLNTGVGNAGIRVLASVGWSPAGTALGNDPDSDQITAAADQCPEVAEDRDGFEDNDGCPDPDNDGDGRPDQRDPCPGRAEDLDGFEDSDGCPDPDNDGDGLADADDTCPNRAEDLDGFEDANGCPDRDNDADGLADADDDCPDQPETPNGFKDADGCADDKPRYVFESDDDNPIVVHSIKFQTGSDNLLDQSDPAIDDIAKSLKKQPGVRVRVEGHTDNVGPSADNLVLSQQRALAVVNELVEDYDINRGRLDYEGYGETRPLVANTDDASRAKNRRVELRVIGRVGR